MNENLEFIQSVIKDEIKTWNGYRREMVDDVGEEEFIKEMSLQLLESVALEIECNKELILESLEMVVNEL